MKRNTHTRAAALAAAFLMFAVSLACADEEGIRILFRSEGSEGGAWSESLASALSRSPLLDAVLPGSAEGDLAEAAARRSCALAVETVSEKKPGGLATSRWSIVDPLTFETLASGAIEGPYPSTRELAEYWWLPLVQATETALPRVKKTLVRVRAAPGTVVTGLGKEAGIIPEEGFLDLPLRVPGTYPWRAESPGAYPERGYFAALEQGQTLEIPRRPIRLWTVETALTMLSYPEIWVHRSLADDMYFLRLGFSQYLAGLYLVREEIGVETPPALFSLPLILPGAGFGMYFLPEDAYVRPYGSATAFARVLLLRGAFGFDTVAPVGLQSALGAEWRAFPRAAVFVEVGASFYPFCDGFLMAASRGDQDGPFLNLFGARWFLELPILRLGARFRL